MSARATPRCARSRRRRSKIWAKPTASQANFIFVDIGRPAKEFRDACAKSYVSVGRDFPPFENTHVRVSIGTMEEMQKAVAVFRDVLRPTSPVAGAGKAGGGGR
jgi:histidinol-phosphate/aromatic aminotransferase/cobyric acid decarboxylase-like protein